MSAFRSSSNDRIPHLSSDSFDVVIVFPLGALGKEGREELSAVEDTVLSSFGRQPEVESVVDKESW